MTETHASALFDRIIASNVDNATISLESFIENAWSLRKEFSLSPTTTGLVNLLIRRHYGKTIQSYVQNSVYNALSKGDTAYLRTIETFQAISWPTLYRTSYMKALVEGVRLKVADILSDIGNDEIIKPDLEKWMSTTLLPFAQQCFGEKYSALTQRELWAAATAQLSIERSNSLFEMVAEYPDSLVVLKELRDCMKASDSLGIVGKNFRTVLRKRLLHMGASTTQILDFYVSMIKAMRILDPSDFLLNYVAAPVREYLLTRKDAIRRIVASLTEGKESDLHCELKQGGSLAYAADEDDEEAGPGVHWEPRKRNKELYEPTGKVDGATRGQDTLALLVSIYGSTDLFIVEYRSLLADKLISNMGYNTDKEVANLELLKIRFGEESLHSCEVMLKDIEDSKRTNNAVHSELILNRSGKQTQQQRDEAISKTVDCVIVSDNYWPSMPSESMVYHPQAAALLQSYQDAYAVLKKPRKLLPACSLGQVEVELDFADGTTRSFAVSPMQASVIMHFQDVEPTISQPNPALSLRQLVTLCEVEEDDLMTSGIQYWLYKGVIQEISSEAAGVELPEDLGYIDPFAEGPDRYFCVVEDQSAMAASDLLSEESEGMQGYNQQESKLSSAASANEKAALIQIESFIKGLLSGHGTMSLDRLHSLLRLLSGGGGSGGLSAGDVRFDMTAQQLRQFMQGLVDVGKVEFMEGLYALCQTAPKPTEESSECEQMGEAVRMNIL